MHDEARTANLLGATALAVSDLFLASVTSAAAVGPSAAAALVILDRSPGLSVTELGRRVGLSQPAAARMVDGLEHHGLVRRERTWGRWVAVRPTEAGTRAARGLLTARTDALREVVDGLEEDERADLDRLLTKVLGALHRTPGDADRLCRLCDRDACVHLGRVCPVGQAERDSRARQPDDG
ncbi:MarR family winged helix-turn-helix transcriptional regulator [Marinactinospora rubrisoli]|uniref:MarR family winged helix-turn-helix transcriptional regulator n=1 Tax=Marinactinospora rubrisoli TaxID=2715399 RepID=A0ABW2KGQ4_9ACTN